MDELARIQATVEAFCRFVGSVHDARARDGEWGPKQRNHHKRLLARRLYKNSRVLR